MATMRNADTDLGKFTQWLARKCRNHDPLAEVTRKSGSNHRAQSEGP